MPQSPACGHAIERRRHAFERRRHPFEKRRHASERQRHAEIRETEACRGQASGGETETEACVRETGASPPACLRPRHLHVCMPLSLSPLHASVPLTSSSSSIFSFFLWLKGKKLSFSDRIKRRRTGRKGHLHAAIWSSTLSLWTRIAVMIAPRPPASAIASELLGSTVTAI